MGSIYLHYLDRELTQSLDEYLNIRLIENITATLLLATNAELYCSLSTLFETCANNEEHFVKMIGLVSNNKLNVISHHPSISEFFESKKTLYKHDANRYPMYFHTNESILDDTEGTSIIFKASSATKALHIALQDVSDNKSVFLHEGATLNHDSIIGASTTISKGLDNIGPSAITWAAFSDYAESITSKFLVRKEISSRYTSHYISFIDGDIVTGINALNYYDFLSVDFPLYDYQILSKIVHFLLPDNIGSNYLDDQFVLKLINWAQQSLRADLVSKIRKLIRALYLKIRYSPEINPVKIRLHIINQLNILFRHTEKPTNTENENIWFLEANATIDKVLNKYSEYSPQNKHEIDIATKYEDGNMTKILICVSTDLEMDTMSDYSNNNGLTLTPQYDGNLVYFSLGEKNGVSLYAIRTQMGSSSIGGSAFAIEEAIRKFAPNCVIAIGIAFGIDSSKQHIGDVLISRQVQCYELQRMGETKVIPRGDKVSANPGLIARCDAAKLTWRNSSIHTGLILSGEKLVDSKEFKNQLIDKEPEAIGGEMEAAGIVMACARHNKSWLIMKGICDWGENKDDGDQALACSNAFDLFFHILKSGGWIGL